jgi:MFS family permease
MELKKNLRLMTWFNFLLDFRFYSPIAIIYFAKVSGSYALGMSIFSITMLTSALFEVPTGIFSDLIGRKMTVVLGALSSVISVVLYAIGGHYIWLVAGAILEGLARSFYSGNNEALLHDWLREDDKECDYAEHLGKTSSMFQWALAVTALIGGILAYLSFPLVMWLSVLPTIGGLILALQMTEPRLKSETSGNVFKHLKESLWLFKTNKKLQSLSIAQSLEYAGGEAGYQFQSAFVNLLWPLWAVGIAKMLSNLGGALSFHFSGRLIKKFKALQLMTIGNAYSFIVTTLSLAFPTVASPIFMSSTSVFYGTGSVAMEDLLQKEYNQKQRSTMGSLNSLFGSLLFAIASLALGLFADAMGPVKALLWLRVLAFISMYLIWNLFRKERRLAALGACVSKIT